MRLGKHIAVIGAGVVGLAVALRLRREGYRVTIYDPDEPGASISAGNAGLIMTAQISPLAPPGLWRKLPSLLSDPNAPLVLSRKHLHRATPWLTRFLRNSTRSRHQAIAETLAPLATRSLDAWRKLLGPADNGRLLRQDGLLCVFKSAKNFRAAQREAEFRRRHGVPSEIIPAEELRQMEPALGPELAGGVLYPDSGHCADPQTLSSTLAIAFRTAGGEVQRTMVRQLASGPHSSVRLITDDGENLCDEVVVSAGMGAPALVKPFGVKPLLVAERGYHVTLSHPKIALRRPIIAGDDRLMVSSVKNGGIRLAGTSEIASVNAPPDWRRTDALMSMAKSVLPEIDGEETATHWIGARPSTPDSLPIVGRAAKNPNIICAFGHSRMGLTLGAVTAEIVTDLITRRGPGSGIAALSPDRF